MTTPCSDHIAKHYSCCSAAEINRLQAEVARLTGCLETANSHHEHFEREWYLRVDRIAELEQSIGLLTTLAPTMEMDSSNPMSMARTIETVVRTRIAELEAGIRQAMEYINGVLPTKCDIQFTRGLAALLGEK